MTKSDLINALRKESNITEPEATTIVNLFFDETTNVLAKGDKVEIRGLCSFYVKKYKGYTERNPRTGKRVKVEGKKLPFFKCGKELMERANLREEANHVQVRTL